MVQFVAFSEPMVVAVNSQQREVSPSTELGVKEIEVPSAALSKREISLLFQERVTPLVLVGMPSPAEI